MNAALRVLRTELLQLARDKRALFSAIVLPALMYPLFFWGTGALEDVGEKTMQERSVTVALTLDELPSDVEARFLEALETGGPLETRTVDAREATAIEDPEERRIAVRALLGRDASDADESAELLVVGTVEPLEAGPPVYAFDLWYDVKSDDSREARGRARGALRAIEKDLTIERREALLGGDPARALSPVVRDVATAEDASGAQLGRWLPFIALLVLVSGGAYAALAVFAGEREAGTLETLLVQPVPHTAIATGKFLAVFVAGMATLVVNLASLVACVSFGLAGADAFGGSDGVGVARLSALVLELPACLLLCALLCLVCGGARTFREGQLLVFPVTLLVIVPTSIVLRPEASLTAMWALVPFAGAGLALRDGLEGDLSVPLAMLMVVGHLGWTALALSRLARVLDAERILGGGGDKEAEGHLRQANARHAVRWGFALVMSFYLIAGSVQRWNMTFGLWFTFWLFLPAFALAIVWFQPRRPVEQMGSVAHRTSRAAGGLLDSLNLRAPRFTHLLGAVLLAPALARGATLLFDWQQRVIPLPAGAEETLESMANTLPQSTFWLLFFFAFSPGVFEELVFRGAMLRNMERDWRWPKIVLWQALYFGIIHTSIYRLLPTGILGAILAGIALRSRSVFPAMLLHAVYNGLIMLSAEDRLGYAESAWFTTWAPLVGPIGVLLLMSKRR